ncbi:MAG TPA: hypothetical protein VFE23_15235 [Usitatibacter sp.]|nr:hypothetical protein [Usitatibacter sp.]
MSKASWISPRDRLPPSGALVAVAYLDGRPTALRRFNLADPAEIAYLVGVAAWMLVPTPPAVVPQDAAVRMSEWDSFFQAD